VADALKRPTEADLDAALAQELIALGRLTAEVAARAQRIATEQGEPLGAALIKLGLVGERELAEVYAKTLRLPMALPEDYPQTRLFEDRLSPRFLRQSRLLPLLATPSHVIVAAADPNDRSAISALEIALSRPVRLRVAVPAEMEAAFARLYGGERPGATSIMADETPATADTDIDRLRDLASEAPVVRLVNHLILDAAEKGASDIHIEPFEHSHRVRYRIDGGLVAVDAPPKEFHAAIVSRIKILAHLDIAERRRPQDGRINISLRGRPIDVRVSTVPTIHGESVALRLLNREQTALGLGDLGFSEATVKTVRRLIEEPNGILLVTGPTGSGKTTTLYAILDALNTPDRKIITVEDPVEYQIEGINQIQVQSAIGLSFADILRSVLRQNPDILMIGEIRDAETAEIAVQAALTGHLVLSTIHTNDAASTITRLVDMGVPEYLVAHTLTGIIAQRLVKRICPECRVGEPMMPELAQRLRVAELRPGQTPRLYKANGCPACHGRGTAGRLPITEAMSITPAIRRLILAHADAKEIELAGAAEGMERMGDDGLKKALKGEVTLKEVLRVARL
jgi:general secretion pathway protein E